VLRDNEPMLRIAREFGFAIDPDGGDAETVTVRRPIRPDEAGAL